MTTARQRRAELRGNQATPAIAMRTTARQRMNGTPAVLKTTPSVCKHLGKQVGSLVCKCSGKARIWECSHPETPHGYAIAVPPREWIDGPIKFNDGKRSEAIYLPWPWSADKPTPDYGILTCDRCPNRELADQTAPAPHPLAVAEWFAQPGNVAYGDQIGPEVLNAGASVCVVTGYTPESEVWRQIGERTSWTMRDYCRRHGYGFRCHTRDFEPGVHPSWSKVKFLREALESHETALWLDADALITNPHIRIEDIHQGPEELALCSDSVALNCGAIMLRRSPFASWLLATLWARRNDGNRLWEQDTMQQLIHHGEIGAHLRIYPPRTFNACVPSKAGRFGFADRFDWRPGDFVAHIYHTGGHAERKVPHVAAVMQAATAGIDHDFIEQSREFLESLPPFDAGRFSGRGIVTSAGGPRLQLNAYVMLRLLRSLGCKLPVELWYDGDRERDDGFAAMVAPLGVRCVDGRAQGFTYQKPAGPITHAGRHTCKVDLALGLNLKVYAVAWSSFAEVLWIDADNCPVRDPSGLFDDPAYTESGSILWPDPAPNYGPNLAAFGTGGYFREGLETGQMLFHKPSTWPALALNCWYNERAEYTYQYSWTDKDTILAAMLRAGLPLNVAPLPLAESQVYGQFGPDGGLSFCHRVGAAKWKPGPDNASPEWFLWHERCQRFVDEYQAAMQ